MSPKMDGGMLDQLVFKTILVNIIKQLPETTSHTALANYKYRNIIIEKV